MVSRLQREQIQSLVYQIPIFMTTLANDITSTFGQILASLAEKEKTVISRRIGLE
jgi:hypothetical protein